MATRPAGYPDTPVLDRRAGPDPGVEQPCDGTILTHSSSVVGPFLDWLERQGVVMARWGEDDDDPDEPALHPISKRFSTLLHDFYGIDENAEEAERRAILDYIRDPDGVGKWTSHPET